MFIEENWRGGGELVTRSPHAARAGHPSHHGMPAGPHLGHPAHGVGVINGMNPSYPCMSCTPPMVSSPPPPPMQKGYYPMGYPPVQSYPMKPRAEMEQPMRPMHPMTPDMANKGSPVLSLCSGFTDYPPSTGTVVNPGLNLLCRAVEEAHPGEGEALNANGGEAPRVKGPWRADEDKLLCELVEKFGPRRWTAIASFIAGRTGKQSRERWLNHLNPDLSKRQWTEEEDRIIMEAHRELGNKWSEIAKRLKGRTDNSVKNRFNTTIRRQISEYSSFVRKEKMKRKVGDEDGPSDDSEEEEEPSKKRPVKEEVA